MEDVRLGGANLQGADLVGAKLKRADLAASHLEGAKLTLARLESADFREAWFDSRSVLKQVELDDRTLLGDIQWGGVGTVNLTEINWERVTRLGDEHEANEVMTSASMRTPGKLRRKSPSERRGGYEASVRAYRQLATQLRAQGMNEDADRFAYRAQFLQQQVLWRQRKFGGYIFSRLLDGLAGYGYKPVRGLIAYIIVILGFAFAYGLATHGILTFGLPRSSIQPLQWYEALVLSISSFHGRGFFQPVQSLGDPVAIIAAVEAIIGLLIEISFIATFTQRFFGR